MFSHNRQADLWGCLKQDYVGARILGERCLPAPHYSLYRDCSDLIVNQRGVPTPIGELSY